MDDVVDIIKRHKVEEFTTHLNSRNPSIKFTVELQEEEQDHQHLPVVDVDIIRWDDRSSKPGLPSLRYTKRKLTLTNI